MDESTAEEWGGGAAGKELLIGPESLRNGRGGGSGPESSVPKNPPGLQVPLEVAPPTTPPANVNNQTIGMDVIINNYTNYC